VRLGYYIASDQLGFERVLILSQKPGQQWTDAKRYNNSAVHQALMV
jgi:hypothetical protein